MTDRETIFVPGSSLLAVDHAGIGPLALFLHRIGGNRSGWAERIDACSGCFTQRHGTRAATAIPTTIRSTSAISPATSCDSGSFRSKESATCRTVDGPSRTSTTGSPIRCPILALCDTRPDFTVTLTPEKRANFMR